MNVAYVRVSKGIEVLDNQKNAIKHFAAEHGDKEIQFFEDIITGINYNRDGFNQMMKYIEETKPERLYVYEISRLGRTMLDTLGVVQQIEKMGTMIFSVSPMEQFLNSANPTYRNLILAMFSWFAEIERKQMISRVRASMDQRRELLRTDGKFISKRGNIITHFGRPRKELSRATVEKYIAKGISYTDIAKIMDVPYITLWRRIKEWGI